MDELAQQRNVPVAQDLLVIDEPHAHLYQDGVDPVISGHVGLTMITEDLIAMGFSKLANRRSWKFADAPVYMMVKNGLNEVFHVMASGTDPLMVHF
jgi:hypothetical protein